MLAEPNWAADTAPWPALGRSSVPVGATAWSAMNGAKMGLQADRAHARSAAAVRGCRRSCAGSCDSRRRRWWRAEVRPDLGVEVGAIHVNLAAVLMHGGADFADGFLEDTVGGRVGDHQRRQLVGVLGGLGLAGRRDRRCRCRRSSRPPRPCHTSARWPGWCRGPTWGSGIHCGVARRGTHGNGGS